MCFDSRGVGLLFRVAGALMYVAVAHTRLTVDNDDSDEARKLRDPILAAKSQGGGWALCILPVVVVAHRQSSGLTHTSNTQTTLT